MATQTRKDLTRLCRELKAPSLLASVASPKRARDETWSYEEFLAACLERDVASRQTHGGDNRIKAARFPAHKTLEDFDFSYQRSIRRDVVAHLGTLDFVEAKDNVIFLGRPETLKTAHSFHPRHANSPVSSRLTWIRRRIWISTKYTDPHTDPMIRYTFVLKPELKIYKIYNGYWYWGRPLHSVLGLRVLRSRADESNREAGHETSGLPGPMLPQSPLMGIINGSLHVCTHGVESRPGPPRAPNDRKIQASA
jgi:hypothetical protein